jgi:hypothetical protein
MEFLTPASAEYTACYCEENIYKLCETFAAAEKSDGGNTLLQRASVVFLSNAHKTVAIRRQRASRYPPSEDGLVIWDYHVVLIVQPSPSSPSSSSLSSSPTLVYDLDTTLPFPCPLLDYATATFRCERTESNRYEQRGLLSEYQCLFRVVAADAFLRAFASDRRHMRVPRTQWQRTGGDGSAVDIDDVADADIAEDDDDDDDDDGDDDDGGGGGGGGGDGDVIGSDLADVFNERTHAWTMPPPPYAAIKTARATHNLPVYWTMDDADVDVVDDDGDDDGGDFGRVLSLDKMMTRLMATQ